MYKFSPPEIYDILDIVERGINPFTKCLLYDNERDIVTKLAETVYAAYNDTAIIFNPLSVTMPFLGIDVKICTKSLSIKELSKNIAKAIDNLFEKKLTDCSEGDIQKTLNKFLADKGLLRLKFDIYKDDLAYFATELGEHCGIKNSYKKTRQKTYHCVIYSTYMQAYLVRIFPDIYVDKLKFQADKNYKSFLNIIEPLNLDEQKLIQDYRELSVPGKQLVKTTVKTLMDGLSAKSTSKKSAN